MQTCRHADIQTYRQTDIRTCRHTDIQTDIQTYRHTDIHTYRHTDIQTYRHTDIQTDIHTYILTYIHTYTHIHTCFKQLRLATFYLKALMWGAGSLFEAVGVLSSFSWTFACPAHCHPSIPPVLISGIFAGFGLGLIFSLWIWWTFTSPLPSPVQTNLAHFPAKRGLGLRPTCLSAQSIAQAANGLTEAILGLTREVRRLRTSEPVAHQPEVGDPGDWELVGGQAAVPGPR